MFNIGPNSNDKLTKLKLGQTLLNITPAAHTNLIWSLLVLIDQSEIMYSLSRFKIIGPNSHEN